MSKEIHPLTEYFKSIGGTTRGWIRVNGLNVHNAASTIYTGDYYDADTVNKLREQGLYEYLYPEVRVKIEAEEARKQAQSGGNGNHE